MVACLPRRRAVPSTSRLIAPYARSDRELRPGWTAGSFLTVEPDESWRFLRKVGEQRAWAEKRHDSWSYLDLGCIVECDIILNNISRESNKI